jgi:uncharacterized protein
MGRHFKLRRINFNPSINYFKPQGIPLRSLRETSLNPDELEALRLKHVKNLDQTQCAKKMGISRSTFQRILASVHQKVALALTEGRAIKIIKRF